MLVLDGTVLVGTVLVATVLAGAGPAFATGTVVLTTGLVLVGSVVGEVEALFERTSFAVW